MSNNNTYIVEVDFGRGFEEACRTEFLSVATIVYMHFEKTDLAVKGNWKQ